MTLSNLFAPVIPFLSEAMYQNLRTSKHPESVHLCDFPAADPALVDQALSADMDALLSLVSLGGAARNVAKSKVRQPLAEFRVQTRDEAVDRALERFPDQLREELNVKRVTRYDGPSLLTARAKLNKKTAAAKLGPKLKEAEAFLATLDAADLAEQLRKGPIDVFGVLLDSTDIVIDYQAAPGWAGVAEKATQVALDARVTDELAREGLARDVIRQVQDRRKKAGLNMEDRIVLYLQTDSQILQSAIDAHRDHIAAETLTVRWSDSPVGEVVEVTIEGHKLKIGVQKAG